MALQIGDSAPSFSLYSSEKELVHLADLKGRNILLLFFPLAFTSTCTKQMCTMRDELDVFNDMNVDVFGISVDSLHSLAKYKETYQLNFTMLSDFNKETVKHYQVMYDEYSYGMKEVGKRAAFVIDGQGLIQYAEVLENAGNIPDDEAIKNAIRTLQPA
jgi:peroxiredoxin